MTSNATQSTISKLPKLPAINPKEELAFLKSKNQELEREISSYKRRLEELRRAKHDLIVKKRTEYVNTSVLRPSSSTERQKKESENSSKETNLPLLVDKDKVNNEKEENLSAEECLYCPILEKELQLITNELNETKNLVVALRLENEDAMSMLDRTRLEAQLEIADLVSKCESYRLRLGEQLIEENRNDEANKTTHQMMQMEQLNQIERDRRLN